MANDEFGSVVDACVLVWLKRLPSFVFDHVCNVVCEFDVLLVKRCRSCCCLVGVCAVGLGDVDVPVLDSVVCVVNDVFVCCCCCWSGSYHVVVDVDACCLVSQLLVLLFVHLSARATRAGSPLS